MHNQNILDDDSLGIRKWLATLPESVRSWFEAEALRLSGGSEHSIPLPARECFHVYVPRFRSGRKKAFQPHILLCDMVEAASGLLKKQPAQERFEEFQLQFNRLCSYFMEQSEIMEFNTKVGIATENLSAAKARAYFRECARKLERVWFHPDGFGEPGSAERLNKIRMSARCRVKNEVRQVQLETLEQPRSARGATLALTAIGSTGFSTEQLILVLLRCGTCVRNGLGKIGKIHDAGQLIRGFQKFFGSREELRRCADDFGNSPVLFYQQRKTTEKLATAMQLVDSWSNPVERALLLLIDPCRRLIWFDYVHSMMLQELDSKNEQIRSVPEYLKSTYKSRRLLYMDFPKDFISKSPPKVPPSYFTETLGRVRTPLMTKLEATIDWRALASDTEERCVTRR